MIVTKATLSLCLIAYLINFLKSIEPVYQGVGVVSDPGNAKSQYRKPANIEIRFSPYRKNSVIPSFFIENFYYWDTVMTLKVNALIYAHDMAIFQTTTSSSDICLLINDTQLKNYMKLEQIFNNTVLDGTSTGTVYWETMNNCKEQSGVYSLPPDSAVPDDGERMKGFEKLDEVDKICMEKPVELLTQDEIDECIKGPLGNMVMESLQKYKHRMMQQEESRIYQIDPVISGRCQTGGYGGAAMLIPTRIYQIGNKVVNFSKFQIVNQDQNQYQGRIINRLISVLWNARMVFFLINLY